MMEVMFTTSAQSHQEVVLKWYYLTVYNYINLLKKQKDIIAVLFG
jgi:hypothetical protein